MIRIMLLTVAGALLAACGGDGAPKVEQDATEGRPAGFTERQVDIVRAAVDADRVEHGQAIGCATYVAVHGELEAAVVVRLAGARGEMLNPWAVGTIGDVDAKGETQLMTLYGRDAGVVRHGALRRTEGEGFVCFRSE